MIIDLDMVKFISNNIKIEIGKLRNNDLFITKNKKWTNFLYKKFNINKKNYFYFYRVQE